MDDLDLGARLFCETCRAGATDYNSADCSLASASRRRLVFVSLLPLLPLLPLLLLLLSQIALFLSRMTCAWLVRDLITSTLDDEAARVKRH
ncbi:Hypothetical predicted protein, partial [Olea europaea subsp. europaea]